MTERDASGGAMSGATGNLTPADLEEPFVPAESRDVADPARVEDEEGASDRETRIGGDDFAEQDEHF